MRPLNKISLLTLTIIILNSNLFASGVMDQDYKEYVKAADVIAIAEIQKITEKVKGCVTITKVYLKPISILKGDLSLDRQLIMKYTYPLPPRKAKWPWQEDCLSGWFPSPPRAKAGIGEKVIMTGLNSPDSAGVTSTSTISIDKMVEIKAISNPSKN